MKKVLINLGIVLIVLVAMVAFLIYGDKDSSLWVSFLGLFVFILSFDIIKELIKMKKNIKHKNED